MSSSAVSRRGRLRNEPRCRDASRHDQERKSHCQYDFPHQTLHLIWRASLGRDGPAFCEQDHRTQAASEAALNLRAPWPRAAFIRCGGSLRVSFRFPLQRKVGLLARKQTRVCRLLIPNSRSSRSRRFGKPNGVPSPLAQCKRECNVLGIPPRLRRTHRQKPRTRLARGMQLATLQAVQGQLGNDRSFATLRLFSDAVNGSCRHAVPQT